jgi:2-oxo-4-hydroxy-4-carboxy--5-ureidoimidazoline (OHCU) decarboxylase
MKTAVLGCDKTKFEILIQGFHGIISHQPWIKREAEKRSEIKNQNSKLKSPMKVENK